MKFTGERFLPNEQGEIRLEHYHRYAIVLDIVAGKDILDLACGEGYGSFQMANTAHSVVGVDVSNEAIKHARETYISSNLSFYQGNAAALDFADNSFDIVVSFETIEHLSEQKKMIAEIRRVLRPQGVLIISSPNRPIYSEENGVKNEFHIKELDFNEFNELLKTEFSAIKYYGQRLLMGSVIQEFEGNQKVYSAWQDDGNNIFPKVVSLKDPVYFVAIAGADQKELPEVSPSILYPNNLDLVKHYVGFAKWAQDISITLDENNDFIVNLNKEVERQNQQILQLNQQISEYGEEISKHIESLREKDNQILYLNQLLLENNSQIVSLRRQVITLDEETVRRGEWGLRLDAELEEERKRLNEAYERINAAINSSSWKITLPLRESKLWISHPKQQTKRYLRKSLHLAKELYQSLPFDIQTIENHRNILVKHAPKLLTVTDTRFDGDERKPLSIEEIEKISAQDIPQIYSFFDSSDHFYNAKSIEINSSLTPIVSIIIPVYGKIGYTLNCLASIAANPSLFPFEIIVVDDCSPDQTFEILQNVNGIQIIQNDENQGFIRSSNKGAAAASGKYLYFLNNDTQATPGWLDELVRTFYEFPGTGLVGSKLVYPDGTLQEAGGIIWQDGSAWNFGRLQNPQLPIYNYAREVDYCSGASIMIPKKLFHELGGFDEYYAPAYCEDSDIALKIRNKGHRVIYQPLSTIIHYEGITSGTSTSEGAKAYQIENNKKLFSRWKDCLSNYQTPGVDIDKAKDRRAKKRVLVLEHCIPTPNQDAGSVTVFNLILLLREMDFQVTFIPEDNFLYVPEYTTALQRVGVEVLYAPYVVSVEQHLKEYGERYDLIFLFRPSLVARNIEKIRQYSPQSKVLYYTHDLHFLRMSREAVLLNDSEKAAEAEAMKLLELEAIRACDASIMVSEQELEIVQNDVAQDKLHVLPLILNTPGTDKGFTERQDIIFVGGFQHTPNIDAVKYFVTEIMPLLRKDLPGVHFYAVGSKVPDEITELASDDVIITGFIEDLTSLLNKMKVSIAPLRYGAGIKGKIGTAMAAGLPVIATSLAAEGMALTDGENILIADSPEDFAKHIIEIYQDENLWNKISKRSMKFANNNWGAESAWKNLANILHTLDFNIVRSNNPLTLYSSLSFSEVFDIEADKLKSSQDIN